MPLGSPPSAEFEENVCGFRTFRGDQPDESTCDEDLSSQLLVGVSPHRQLVSLDAGTANLACRKLQSLFEQLDQNARQEGICRAVANKDREFCGRRRHRSSLAFFPPPTAAIGNPGRLRCKRTSMLARCSWNDGGWRGSEYWRSLLSLPSQCRGDSASPLAPHSPG